MGKEIIFEFNIVDDGAKFSIVLLFGLLVVLVYLASNWIYKGDGKLSIRREYGLWVGGMGLVIILAFNGIEVYQLYSHISDYRNGRFLIARGAVEELDDRFRAYEDFYVNGVRFEINQSSIGCYSTLAEDNTYFSLGSYIQIKYLEDGCIVELNIYDK